MLQEPVVRHYVDVFRWHDHPPDVTTTREGHPCDSSGSAGFLALNMFAYVCHNSLPLGTTPIHMEL